MSPSSHSLFLCSLLQQHFSKEHLNLLSPITLLFLAYVHSNPAAIPTTAADLLLSKSSMAFAFRDQQSVFVLILVDLSATCDMVDLAPLKHHLHMASWISHSPDFLLPHWLMFHSQQLPLPHLTSPWTLQYPEHSVLDPCPIDTHFLSILRQSCGSKYQLYTDDS